MRAHVVASGVLMVSLVAGIAAAQGSFGAVPAPGGSFPPAAPAQPIALPPPPPGVLARPPAAPAAPVAISGGFHPGVGVVPHRLQPPGVATPIRPDPFRPTLGNAPAQPLTNRGPVDLYRAKPWTYGRLSRTPFVYGGGYTSYDTTDPNAQAGPAPRPGYIVFRVQPAATEVFVDGYYVGTVADLSAGRALPEGAYRLELRASDFDTVTTDVRILPGETITLNRSLTRTAAPAPPAIAQAPPAPAKPFYVIRGCYAGSTHPKDVKLPAGCDVRNVRVVPPVVNIVSGSRSTVPGPRS